MSLPVFHTTDPPNAGVPPDRLGDLMSQDQMYVRCNFPLPPAPPSTFEVEVPGRPARTMTVDDLDEYPRVDLDLVLECAGNGRTLMDPVPEGTPWALDGVSAISVGGVRLADVLGRLPEEVVDVVFTGADRGRVEPEGDIPYQFSLDRELASSPLPLLVTHIGGEPLTLTHGAPVRLLVPGHYAMKSVKWLTRIEAVTEPFTGHFVSKYRYLADDIEPEGAPVGQQQVRSVITSPADGTAVTAGVIEVQGSAWSGTGDITSVEVSIDGETSWQPAEVTTSGHRFAVTRWSLPVTATPGTLEIAARATDSSGATQPSRPRWNRNGYANNVVHRVTVEVTPV